MWRRFLLLLTVGICSFMFLSRPVMRLPMLSGRCVEMRRACAEKWPCPLHVNAHLNFRLFRDWRTGAEMSEPTIVPVRTWLAVPMGHDVSEAIDRLRRAPDVQQIAVMPDVHLASDVCIGVAVATSNLIYPQAVGGDIGCGMLAVKLNADATCLKNPKTAGVILSELGRAIPSRRRNRRSTIPLPDDLANDTLTHPSLESCRRNEGVLQFATLGSGNHFIEIQADEDDRVWLMVHSGSRALGQAIRDHHLGRAQTVGSRFRVLEAGSPEGSEYLHDASYARRFADASRKAMATEIGRLLAHTLHAQICWETLITT